MIIHFLITHIIVKRTMSSSLSGFISINSDIFKKFSNGWNLKVHLFGRRRNFKPIAGDQKSVGSGFPILHGGVATGKDAMQEDGE